jgi:hypothetical protein
LTPLTIEIQNPICLRSFFEASLLQRSKPIRTLELKNPQFWLELAPNLHLGDSALVQRSSRFALTDTDILSAKARLIREGYFQKNGLSWGVDVDLMVQTVREIDALCGLPVFAFLYDEFWIPFYQLYPIYRALLGDFKLLPDCWIWNVDPKRADSGWSPHRDKNRDTLFPDGSPKSLTTWIPLSRATPLNGCMYIVPAHLDPTYNTPDEAEYRFEYSSIRALPAEPGDLFMWNQAVVHWGSKTSILGEESRVSMAFECQRADVAPMNNPLLHPLTFCDFNSRLKLIAKQILQYRHMYKVDSAIEQMAQETILGV